ncbi:MAG TPA: hypothetical protein VGC72_06750, partial [Candidatus Elarobacter sp.]
MLEREVAAQDELLSLWTVLEPIEKGGGEWIWVLRPPWVHDHIIRDPMRSLLRRLKQSDHGTVGVLRDRDDFSVAD